MSATAAAAAPEIAACLLRPPESPPRHSNTDDDFELLLVERGGTVLELVTGARRKYENKHMALAREVQSQTGLRLPPAVPALQNIGVRDRILAASNEILASVAAFHVLLQRTDTHKMRDRLIVPQALLAIEALGETSASAQDVERLAARVGAPVRLVWCPLWLLKRLALPPMSPVTGAGGRKRRTLGPLLQWYMRHHIAYELLSVPGALLNRPYAVDDAAAALRHHQLQQQQQQTSEAAYELAGPRTYSTDWAVVAASAATLAAARRINAQSAVSPRPAVPAPLALAICCSDLVDDDGEPQQQHPSLHHRQRLCSPSAWNVLLRQVPGKRGTMLLDLVTARTPVSNAESDRAIKGAVVRTMRECFGLICKAEVNSIVTWSEEEQQETAAAAKDWKLLCMHVGHSSAVSLLDKPVDQMGPPHDALRKAGWHWWSMQRLQHLHIMRVKAKKQAEEDGGLAQQQQQQRMFLGRPIEAYFFGPALTEFLRRDGWYSCCPSVATNDVISIAPIWRPPATSPKPTTPTSAAAAAAADTSRRARGPLEDGEVDEAEGVEDDDMDVICAPTLPPQPLLPLHRALSMPPSSNAATTTTAIATKKKQQPIGSELTTQPTIGAAVVVSVWAQLVTITGGYDPALLQSTWAAAGTAAQKKEDMDNAPRPPSPERYPRYRHPHYFRLRKEEEAAVARKSLMF